jgi:hypothetical protein
MPPTKIYHQPKYTVNHLRRDQNLSVWIYCQPPWASRQIYSRPPWERPKIIHVVTEAVTDVVTKVVTYKIGILQHNPAAKESRRSVRSRTKHSHDLFAYGCSSLTNTCGQYYLTTTAQWTAMDCSNGVGSAQIASDSIKV